MHELHRLIVLASAAAAVITVPVFAQAPPDNTTPAQAQPPHAPPAQAQAAPARPAAAAQPAKASDTADGGFKRTPAPADAYVYIGWPNDNETVRTTHIKVWFGTRNFGVAPAGTNKPNTGHHHLLIDTALPPLDQPIPNDKNHLHFGLGQTETLIDLPPGTHTLQTPDGRRRPYSARSAGDVEEDHHPCPCSGNPRGGGALRPNAALFQIPRHAEAVDDVAHRRVVVAPAIASP